MARPLTAESLRLHEAADERSASDLAASGQAVRRQYHCRAHGLFWRKVYARDMKQVAHCRFCDAASPSGRGPKYAPIPREAEIGRGEFECLHCGKTWQSNHACRSLAQLIEV